MDLGPGKFPVEIMLTEQFAQCVFFYIKIKIPFLRKTYEQIPLKLFHIHQIGYRWFGTTNFGSNGPSAIRDLMERNGEGYFFAVIKLAILL